MKGGNAEMAVGNVLIVEDDRDLRETLSSILEMSGISVQAAANGKEALELLEGECRPCVIILDLMMPVMDGWQFLKERQQKEHLRRIPVIVSSAFAHDLPQDIEEVLKKPTDLDQLLNTVMRYCGTGA